MATLAQPQPQPQPLPRPRVGAKSKSNANAVSEQDEQDELGDMLRFFASHFGGHGSVRSSAEFRQVQERVNELFDRDYHVSLLENAHGELCTTYPLQLVLLENEKKGPYRWDEACGPRQRVNDKDQLKRLLRESRFSRVHGRFVVPSILVRNKNICRSATLSCHAEAILNSVHAKTKEFVNGFFSSASKDKDAAEPGNAAVLDVNSQRCADKALLTALGTRYVCDLMVEKKKKKYGLLLTSSEKVEPEAYAQFNINCIPYPGCEFFKRYRDNHHQVGCLSCR